MLAIILFLLARAILPPVYTWFDHFVQGFDQKLLFLSEVFQDQL